MSGAGSVVFVLCAAAALVSAVLTISARRPLRAAVALLAHMVALAGLYLTLHAQALAALQLFVYAGGIVTLFVMVVMMIGTGDSATGNASEQKSARASLLARVAGLAVALIFAVLMWVALGDNATRIPGLPDCDPTNGGQCDAFGGIAQLGHALFGDAWLPFELTSVLLLVAAVGAIALHAERRRQPSTQRLPTSSLLASAPGSTESGLPGTASTISHRDHRQDP